MPVAGDVVSLVDFRPPHEEGKFPADRDVADGESHRAVDLHLIAGVCY